MIRLYGMMAIFYAESKEQDGVAVPLSKSCCNVEGERSDLSIDEARKIANDAPYLIYVDAPAEEAQVWKA